MGRRACRHTNGIRITLSNIQRCPSRLTGAAVELNTRELVCQGKHSGNTRSLPAGDQEKKEEASTGGGETIPSAI